MYDDGEAAQEILVLQTVQFPKVPVGGPSTWPSSSASQLESLGAILASKAEKEEQKAKSKAIGTKRSKEAAKGGDSGEWLSNSHQQDRSFRFLTLNHASACSEADMGVGGEGSHSS